MRKCEQCGHSWAAHVDQLRCALCGCMPQRKEFVQESFSFRSALRGAAQNAIQATLAGEPEATYAAGRAGKNTRKR